ncbi:MAG: 3-dehydroquinate synthase [Alphaproteobacteria bacterium]|nr:3-dehydroquinate synthase [Alphaproteobacteria bacterium]
MPETTVVKVGLGARAYDIHVGVGAIDRAGALIAPLAGRGRVVAVSDRNVWPLHGERLTAALRAAGLGCESIVLPAGESTKSFEGLAGLLDRLLDLGVERRDLILAFGGGVIGDLAGFAAAILKRGVDYAQIPTTLLAQVDSSVGGKTAIDVRQGKNLVGAFHQPRLVIADVGLLHSLPERERRAGYAEIVKYGLIDDTPFFAQLEREHGALETLDLGRIAGWVTHSCRAKARVVEADEREQGMRELLNLGHTFGHALEAALGYDEALRHGEAVALGMAMAFRLSERLGLCRAEDRARVEAHLAAVGLPTRRAQINGLKSDAAALYALMRQDKKTRDGRPRFVLARGIGKAFPGADAPESDVLAVLS